MVILGCFGGTAISGNTHKVACGRIEISDVSYSPQLQFTGVQHVHASFDNLKVKHGTTYKLISVYEERDWAWLNLATCHGAVFIIWDIGSQDVHQSLPDLGGDRGKVAWFQACKGTKCKVLTYLRKQSLKFWEIDQFVLLKWIEGHKNGIGLAEVLIPSDWILPGDKVPTTGFSSLKIQMIQMLPCWKFIGSM